MHCYGKGVWVSRLLLELQSKAQMSPNSMQHETEPLEGRIRSSPTSLEGLSGCRVLSREQVGLADQYLEF